jgi:hypothetical protein
MSATPPRSPRYAGLITEEPHGQKEEAKRSSGPNSRLPSLQETILVNCVAHIISGAMRNAVFIQSEES